MGQKCEYSTLVWWDKLSSAVKLSFFLDFPIFLGTSEISKIADFELGGVWGEKLENRCQSVYMAILDKYHVYYVNISPFWPF